MGVPGLQSMHRQNSKQETVKVGNSALIAEGRANQYIDFRSHKDTGPLKGKYKKRVKSVTNTELQMLVSARLSVDAQALRYDWSEEKYLDVLETLELDDAHFDNAILALIKGRYISTLKREEGRNTWFGSLYDNLKLRS